MPKHKREKSNMTESKNILSLLYILSVYNIGSQILEYLLPLDILNLIRSCSYAREAILSGSLGLFMSNMRYRIFDEMGISPHMKDKFTQWMVEHQAILTGPSIAEILYSGSTKDRGASIIICGRAEYCHLGAGCALSPMHCLYSLGFRITESTLLSDGVMRMSDRGKGTILKSGLFDSLQLPYALPSRTAVRIPAPYISAMSIYLPFRPGAKLSAYKGSEDLYSTNIHTGVWRMFEKATISTSTTVDTYLEFNSADINIRQIIRGRHRSVKIDAEMVLEKQGYDILRKYESEYNANIQNLQEYIHRQLHERTNIESMKVKYHLSDISAQLSYLTSNQERRIYIPNRSSIKEALKNEYRTAINMLDDENIGYPIF